MRRLEPRSAPFVLSLLVALLAAAASAGGLLLPTLYRDNRFVTSAWRGNDLVTLLLAIPLLLCSLLLSVRGSARARGVWLGMLAYMLYGYAFYLFGAAFNRFFLIYAALVATSLVALVFAVPGLDANELAPPLDTKALRRLVGGYMIVTALGLGGAWVAMSLDFVATGRVPEPIVASGHPTGVVFALDLTLLVPWFLVGGIWLWQHKPWGYVLAVVLNVKGAVYTLGLSVSSIVAGRAGVKGATAELPLWLALSAASTLACLILLVRGRTGPKVKAWTTTSID